MSPPSHEEMNHWASAALAQPVRVQFRRLHVVLVAFVGVFFGGITIAALAANGFNSVTLLLLLLNVAFLSGFFYVQTRAKKKLATLFDLSGVTCGDHRRLPWNEFKGVDYLLHKVSPTRTNLWRVELDFAGGRAWIIPIRTRNWSDVEKLIQTLPGVHQERPA